MATHTQIPFENLSAWYFAVRWSRTNLEATIEKAETAGLSCKYDRAQQERLEQLELYLQTTWDTWMRRPMNDDMAIGGMVKLEATNES
jgi:hypothetical protein